MEHLHATTATFGFGAYRVNDSEPAHEAALRHALACGVQVIDTSTNYANGASEQLVGRILADTPFIKSLPKPPVIITKIGYAQGETLEMITAQATLGQPYDDVVVVTDGLQHCIHPDFLSDMLTLSLQRLQSSRVDVLLLHNPEYFLQVEHQQGTDVETARTEFYRRIAGAFAWLQQAVVDGRIGSYGISSNTFAYDTDMPDHVSLERCLQIASALRSDHAFTHVQFPLNLIEHHAVTTLNQRNGDASTLDVAREHQLTVITNRPLNALVGGDLIRLASHDVPMHTADIVRVDSRIHELETEEHDVLQIVLDNPSHTERDVQIINESFRVAGALCTSWNKFEGLIHWRDVRRTYLMPRVEIAMKYALGSSDAVRAGTYVQLVADLISDIEALYAAEENAALEELREAMADELGLPMDTALQNIALHAVRCTEGVGIVLVGMRSVDYVDDVLYSYGLPETTYHRTTWNRITDHLARLSEQP